jgi:Tol biopolymer transport system component
VDPAGKKSALREKPGDYQAMRFSPDGARLALAVNDGSSQDIWIYEQTRDSMTRLTFGGSVYDAPTWSPDGRYVVFASVGNGLFWTRSDGAGQPQPLTQSKTVQIPISFSPGGKRLGYFELAGAPQMWTVPLEYEGGLLKAGKPEQFLKTQFAELGPGFSPDGHWVAYQSNESGKNEIYVRAFPQPASGQGGKWQISNDIGQFPVWSRNGHELIYRSGDKLMKVNYTVKGDSFVNEKPSVWIDKLGGTTWDLAPDDRRVGVLQPVDTPKTPEQEHEVVILFNFLDELRRRVPIPK